jgi:hypothetical protein
MAVKWSRREACNVIIFSDETNNNWRVTSIFPHVLMPCTWTTLPLLLNTWILKICYADFKCLKILILNCTISILFHPVIRRIRRKNFVQSQYELLTIQKYETEKLTRSTDEKNTNINPSVCWVLNSNQWSKGGRGWIV